MLQLHRKDSNMPLPIDIIPQIPSLQFDPLDKMSLFSACKMTYTPQIVTYLNTKRGYQLP
jgi:hypothetical protein